MEHQNPLAPEVTFEHHQDTPTFKKRILKTTIILSVITLIELGLGFVIYLMHKGGNPSASLVLTIKGVICILTLAKAYYIISIFMHLGDERRSFVMTIVLPALLFVWFIISFLWDGSAYRSIRNQYDKHFYETTTPKHANPIAAPAPATDTLQRQ